MNQKQQKDSITNFNNSLLLPRNEEAEQAAIGAMLLEKEAVYEVIDFLKPEMFYDPYLQDVYQAILNVTLKTDSVDAITVVEELKAMKKEVDPYKLTTLIDNISSAGHIQIHAMVVQQEYIRRMFVLKCTEGLIKSADGSIDVVDLVDEHIYSVENLTNVEDSRGTTHVSDVVKNALKEYEQRAIRSDKGEAPGLHTGLKKLDTAIHGFQKGSVYILAARPGMGKTAFALHIARKTALQGNSVVIFSLEMTKSALINRMIIAQSGINGDSFKQGKLNGEELNSLSAGADNLYHLPIHINDNAGTTIQNIRAECKKLARKGELDLVVIDYLQLVNVPYVKGRTKNDEVSVISRDVKLMAKDLDVPVILLSQLNREVEKRSDKIPMLSDLRDSGSIEQDADVVMFLYRPIVYSENANRNEGLIRIAKNRENQQGDVSFWVADDVTDFRDKNNYEPIRETPF